MFAFRGASRLITCLVVVQLILVSHDKVSCERQPSASNDNPNRSVPNNRSPRMAVIPFGWSPRPYYPPRYYTPYVIPAAHIPAPVQFPRPHRPGYRKEETSSNEVSNSRTYNVVEETTEPIKRERFIPGPKSVETKDTVKTIDLAVPIRPATPAEIQALPTRPPPFPTPPPRTHFSPSFDTMDFKPSNFPHQLKERERKINDVEVEKKVIKVEVQLTEMPRTSASNIERMLSTVFSKPRNDETNATAKNLVRTIIYDQFVSMGFESFLHNFTELDKNDTDGSDIEIQGTNVVGIIAGSNAGTPFDKILLVGAHYDTFKNSPGVNDNGSGMTVMIEVMRNLAARKCKFQNSIMFAAFDQEEQGGLGSFHFVNEYLIPMVLQSGRGSFQGAFILDTILNYNNTNQSQELPSDIQEAVPSLNKYVTIHGNAGNFLSMMSRHAIDDELTDSLKRAWTSLEKPEYKLHDMPVDLGGVIPPMNVLSKRINFVRSDHAMFWYHNNTNSYPATLKSILITDTGPFRGRMKECYHAQCDDVSFVTPENIQLAKKLGDSLIMSLMDLGNGSCSNQEYLASTYNEGNSLTLTIASCMLAVFLIIFNHDSKV